MKLMNIICLIKYRQSNKYYNNNLDSNDFNDDDSDWDYKKDLVIMNSIMQNLDIGEISKILHISIEHIQNRINQIIEIIGMETNLNYTNRLLDLKKGDDLEKVDNKEYLQLTNEHLLSARSLEGGYKAVQLKLLGISWPLSKGWKKTIIGKNFEKKIIDRFVNFNKPTTRPISQYFSVSREKDLIEKDNSIKTQTENDIEPDYFVYTDGACEGNGSINSIAGYGIYFGVNDQRNVSQRLEGRQTNNTAELIALIKLYDIIKIDLEKGMKIGIVSDSKYAIGCCSHYGEKCAKHNWGQKKKNEIPNIELLKKSYSIYKNQQNIKWIHVKAHTDKKDPHSLGNNEADRLANQAIGLEKCPYQSSYKIYFQVPYNRKEEIKKYGGKWDKTKKSWYSYDNNSKIDMIKKIFQETPGDKH